MPSTKVDYSNAYSILNNTEVNDSSLISTPYGLSILELQGELKLPQSAPASNEVHRPEYLENFVKVDEIYYAVKFGKLEFDPKDPSKITLFIGKSQRLLGSLVDLDIPLAILRVPTRQENGDDIKIIDIIKKKMIFKERPLPIM